MADIDERIAEFLNEKFASESATPSIMERIALRLSSEVVSLVSVIERAVARMKDLLTYRSAAVATPARSALRQELADHMRDAYDHQLELGRDTEAAWDYVKGHFGDYETILGELEELHQPTPLWEWITRVLAFVVGLCLLHYTGVSIRDVTQPTFALALLIAAPLAAFEPRAWRLPRWMRWLARGLALFFFVFPARAEGSAYSDIFSATVVIVMASLLARPFSSPHFAARMRAWMLAITFGYCALGLHDVWINANDPSKMGAGIAVVFIGALYGVLLARPRLWALLLLAAACHASVAMLAYVAIGWPAAFKAGINPAFFYLPMIEIKLGLLAAWAFYGRRGYACWFQSAGLVAMILAYISYLKNMDGRVSLGTIMFNVSLPLLLLWLVPAAGVVWRKFRREE